MSETTPGWPPPGERPDGSDNGPEGNAPESTPASTGASAGDTDPVGTPPISTEGGSDFAAPTPPPPPPPLWYGETAPLPQPPQASVPPGHPAPGAYPSSYGAPVGTETHGQAGPVTSTPARRAPRRWLDVVVAAVVAALVAGATAGLVVHAHDDNAGAGSQPSSSSSSSTVPAPVPQANGSAPDWATTAAAVEPSVVAITVGSASSGSEAQGSGIILDSSGHVLTNNHVATAVSGAPITVTLTDQRTYRATVVGTDATTDLAVLKITNAPGDLKPASLGDSSKLAVGQPVMAVGNPLGLADTVTTGIVSALDRPVTTQSSDGQGADSGGNNAVITNAIQTDAAINPGNSGGALVTASGQVIGINSSIASLGGGSAFGGSSESGSIGLGFAIPINEAKSISQQLISSGTVKHPFLGVSLQDGNVTQGGAQRAAAEIVSVTSGTPAASAGLKKGDAVVGIDKDPVNGALALTAEVRARAVGEKVNLTVIRDGKQMTVTVTLAARPSGS
jgi:putative serine protease PepD